VGSALHECMELLFAGRKPHEIIGLTLEGVEITTQLFDAKIIPAMEAFTRYVEDRPIVERFVEQHLELPPVPGAFGTADVILSHADGALSVIDWKFGEGVQVNIEDNAQLLFYAAAAMFRYPSDTYHLVIIQPNSRGLPTLRQWTVDRWTLMEFAATLRWAVKNGHRDELLASGPHCRWCPVKPVCPKLRADTKALSTWQNPHPELTSVQMGEYLDLAEKAEEWAAAVKQYAHERLENGEFVDGWKLVPKRAIRKWADGAEPALRAKFAMPDCIYTHELKSPAQIEKEFKISTDGLTESRSSGTTLARDDDARDAVVPSNPLRRLATLIGKSK
jgi:hypothetical protein